MSRFIACLALLYMALSAPLSSAQTVQGAPPAVNLLTWPRMPVQQFGCYLEKSLGYRDSRFNCALSGYKNHGDPCKNTDAYYEGPAFPAALAGKVHPLASEVELSWEQGRLQEVTVTLKGRLTDQQVRTAMKLPPVDAKDMPKNVIMIDVQYPNASSTAVSLVGFDHMGGGDADCGG